MERNRAATCMVDKEFLAICSSYTIFITSYFTASCETFCTATNMVDEKETRAICSFYTVFAISYFITFYEIFTTDQQSTKYRTNNRCASITIGVKLVLISEQLQNRFQI
jgi:hypothetical protein